MDEFARFGAMDVTKTYEFIGFGAMDVTKPCEFTGFGSMDVTNPLNLQGLKPWSLVKHRLGFTGGLFWTRFGFRLFFGFQIIRCV